MCWYCLSRFCLFNFGGCVLMTRLPVFHRSHLAIHLGITGHNNGWNPQVLLISNLKPHIFTDWSFGTWFWFFNSVGNNHPNWRTHIFSFPAVIRPWRDADVQALHRPATPSIPRRRQRHLGVALRAALCGRRPRGAAVGAAKGAAGAGLADAGGVGGVDGQGSLGRSDLWPASGIVWIIYIYISVCIYIS